MNMASCKPFSLDLAADQSKLPHYVPPPCQVACPIGTDVASYVGLIWENDKAGALEAITATNPLSIAARASRCTSMRRSAKRSGSRSWRPATMPCC